MEKRHALSDDQWDTIADLMPSNNGPGRPWAEHRLIIDGILWIFGTAAPWRNLPKRFGPWKTVYDRFRRWVREGVWERILERLLAGDKGYSASHIRDWLKEHRIQAVIPHRENESGRDAPFDRQSYRCGNIIEGTIGCLKEFRRIATRYEKLATHYLGMITLGMILQYLTY